MVGSYPPITAPALVLVGAMMTKSLKRIQSKDPSEAILSLLRMIGIPMTYSVADRVALGFIRYPLSFFLDD